MQRHHTGLSLDDDLYRIWMWLGWEDGEEESEGVIEQRQLPAEDTFLKLKLKLKKFCLVSCCLWHRCWLWLGGGGRTVAVADGGGVPSTQGGLIGCYHQRRGEQKSGKAKEGCYNAQRK